MTNETATNPLALDFSPSRIRQHERSGVDEAESEVMGSGACQVGTMANGGGLKNDNIWRDHIRTI